jgi:hypothetical protein
MTVGFDSRQTEIEYEALVRNGRVEALFAQRFEHLQKAFLDRRV